MHRRTGKERICEVLTPKVEALPGQQKGNCACSLTQGPGFRDNMTLDEEMSPTTLSCASCKKEEAVVTLRHRQLCKSSPYPPFP